MNATTFPSVSTRINAWLSSVTFVYKLLAVMMVAIYLPSIFVEVTQDYWCFNPLSFIKFAKFKLCTSICG